ncbi:bifunctional riboflavin kinase/FAD synthetase [Pelovirga terrestris]|uniref:Riboflavin biosynthesis protein n=1 Tax=Pelovirga terrestris TaxID=2771352 RepID=A0A8J6QJS8_9BACT|nr:bifunctional riboflavin kinase/FAD synthetase [Pelovirga terrestris]
MIIIDSLTRIPDDFAPSVVTLGNFDGVHLGHRALFRRLTSIARTEQLQSVVCTFYPHPLKVLAPDNAPLLLNTREERRRLIAASHVDWLIEIPFDRSFAQQSPAEFVDKVLLNRLAAQKLVVGYDYAFGQGRSGTPAFLRDFCAGKGVAVDIVEPVSAAGTPYSSTRIRQLISAGRVADVLPLLGRHYNLYGEVVSGFQRGRELGFPTANISTEKELIPAPGVYVVKVRHGDLEYGGVVNVGYCPTFGCHDLSIEVHLLDYSGEIYGEKLRVYFIERLRDETAFANVNELTVAIAEDVLKARQILQRVQVVQYSEYLPSNA